MFSPPSETERQIGLQQNDNELESKGEEKEEKETGEILKSSIQTCSVLSNRYLNICLRCGPMLCNISYNHFHHYFFTNMHSLLYQITNNKT